MSVKSRMFSKGDLVIIIPREFVTPAPEWCWYTVVRIDLVVDSGYEFLDDKGTPWFIYGDEVRKVTKLDKALK